MDESEIAMLEIHIYHYPYMTDFADSSFLAEEHQIALLKVLDAGNLSLYGVPL